MTDLCSGDGLPAPLVADMRGCCGGHGRHHDTSLDWPRNIQNETEETRFGLKQLKTVPFF